jgi:ABC-2 type transport system permease protein
MSDQVSSASTSTAPRPLDVSGTAPVSMATLAKVELRKSLDTRAGRWLVVGILGVLVVVEVIFSLAASDADRVFETYLGIGGAVLGYFMPLLVIMLVTSEASQRNGLVTFTLEPRRPRVVVAKFLAGFALAAMVTVLAFVLAVLGNLFGSALGGDGSWDADGNILFNGFILGNVIGVLLGFALATLLMNTAAAIVAHFAYTLILPTAVGILSALSETFEDIAPWIEFNTAQVPLFTGDYTPTGEQWAQIAVSGFVWLVVPLALGIWRLLRIEFK